MVCRLLALAALALTACAGAEEGVLEIDRGQYRVLGANDGQWIDVRLPERIRLPREATGVELQVLLPPSDRPRQAQTLSLERVRAVGLDALAPSADHRFITFSVPGDGQPHVFRLECDAPSMMRFNPVRLGTGSAVVFSSLRQDWQSVLIGSALFTLGLALLLVGLLSRDRLGIGPLGLLSTSLGVITLTQIMEVLALARIGYSLRTVLHEGGIFLAPAGLGLAVRAVVRDTERRLLLRAAQASALLWPVSIAAIHLGVIDVPHARLAGYLIAFFTFAQIFRVARAEAFAAPGPARSLLLGTAVLVLCAIPDMAAGLGLVPDAYSFADYGTLFLVVAIGVAIGGRAKEHAAQLAERVKELEQQRGEIQSLNEELRRQITEKTRMLANALGAAATPSERMPEAGEVFENYRVVKPLGRGGMGAVFEVRRLSDDKPLALKVMTAPPTSQLSVRFLREAEIAARVLHPNLVPVVDVGTGSSGSLFLVMELVQGRSLDAFDRKYGDLRWAFRVLKQIADGLEALHKAGVVHRDLKPANVMVDDRDGRVRLCDFGIAHVLTGDDPFGDTAQPGAPPAALSLTATGATIGTPRYLPPELVGNARAVSTASDVYSLALLACELCASHYPFAQPPIFDVMAGRPVPEPDLTPLLRAGARAQLAQLVADALAVDPSKRPMLSVWITALRDAA